MGRSFEQPLCINGLAAHLQGTIVTTPDMIEPVSVALIDLRATLEAQLRQLIAAQACLGYHRQNPAGGALVHCAEHLQRFSGLAEASAAGHRDAVAALKRVLDVPSVFVLLSSSGSSTEH